MLVAYQCGQNCQERALIDFKGPPFQTRNNEKAFPMDSVKKVHMISYNQQ